MKNILIIYSKMVIGGSTTSLLSLLNAMDYSKYSLDLLLYDNTGELQDQINHNVKILPPVGVKSKKRKKYLRPDYWLAVLKARALSKKYNKRLIISQLMAKYEAISCPSSEKKYDVGISFLEFWPMEYLVRRVQAKKKIGWIHIDIKEAGLLSKVGNKLYSRLDKIVVVSDSCAKNMLKIYPEQADKVVCVENILVSDTIENMSKQKSTVHYELGEFNFVSACRLVLVSKGLDRGVNAFERLKQEGILDSKIKWFIIGDGLDRSDLEEMITEKGLSDNIILLGQQRNPYAIEKDMDVFLLPSRYEGKPMAVTEAQMLGLVPIVCNYSSANEQICNGVDGLIAQNDDSDIYYKIKHIIKDRDCFESMRSAVIKKEFSNVHIIKNIEQLMEE